MVFIAKSGNSICRFNVECNNKNIVNKVAGAEGFAYLLFAPAH